MSKNKDSSTILVVDDEALLRWHATDMLTDNGYTVLEADKPRLRCGTLEERPDVRLLFTDIQMPGACNSIDLARKVHDRWPYVLLLVTSGGVTVAEEDMPDHVKFCCETLP